MPALFSYNRLQADPARVQAVIDANTIGVDKAVAGNNARVEGPFSPHIVRGTSASHLRKLTPLHSSSSSSALKDQLFQSVQ